MQKASFVSHSMLSTINRLNLPTDQLIKCTFPFRKSAVFSFFFLSCIQASGENCEAKTEGESRTSITPLHYYHASPRSSDENVTLI